MRHTYMHNPDCYDSEMVVLLDALLAPEPNVPMTISQPKLQQLHARLEGSSDDRWATRRDLRDLVACLIEPESVIIGETPIGSGEGKLLHLSDKARARLNLPATDVDAAMTRLREITDSGLGLAANQDVRIVVGELARLRARLEQTEVQLAGCSAAALGHGEFAKPGDYGWSASYGDVLALRLRAEAKPEQAGRECFVMIGPKGNLCNVYDHEPTWQTNPGFRWVRCVLDPEPAK